MSTGTTWIVSQLGAREHYAIPRALHLAGCLDRLITDFWCTPTSWVRRSRSFGRLHERWHKDLADAHVASSVGWFFCEELIARINRSASWDRLLRRNDRYQHFACKQLQSIDDSAHVMFSYSYTARRLLEIARSRGWVSIVGQIDPGPEEERIVASEHERYDHVRSQWRPAPSSYWDQWREEMDGCDRIMVNSSWSAECLAKENIASQKISVVPLVYAPDNQPALTTNSRQISKPTLHGETLAHRRRGEPIEILFLGQINLRKGIGRLIDAMRLLSSDRRFRLTLAGPTEVDPDLWSALPNVRWIGPLKRSQVAEAYQNANVFILPTLSDGYALTQLEALSHGLPVISSHNCGKAIQHGRNGLILNDLEPETIVDAICSLPDFQWHAPQKTPFGIGDLMDCLKSLTLLDV